MMIPRLRIAVMFQLLLTWCLHACASVSVVSEECLVGGVGRGFSLHLITNFLIVCWVYRNTVMDEGQYTVWGTQWNEGYVRLC